ncbi:MAG TPA: hypothetical protein VJM31_12935 [Vicinamibacterales bacterium]|nr:hypothetical protein [Vicinamibacterales bacterium]
MPHNARILVSALCVAATLSCGVTVWRLLDSPLRHDESDFGIQAAGIIEHGVPKVVDHGEVRYGMWHPPLYLYSVAASRFLFGPANWSSRLAGVAWFAATAIVVFRLAGPLALCLLLLAPIVAQGILYLDIDNTSLAFALTLFGAVFVMAPRPHSMRTAALLCAILFLALWSKLTTPYIMLIAVVVFQVLNRDWRGTVQTVAIGAVATAAFLGAYLLYCRLTGYPVDFMFDTTYVGKRDSYLTSSRSLVKPLHAIWWNIIWFSPALTALFGVLTLERMRTFWRTRCADSIDFWVIFAWAVFGAYAVWAGVMGKYTFPAAVAAAVALGLWLPGLVSTVRVKKPVLLTFAAAALLTFQVLAVPALQVKPAAAHEPLLTLSSGLTHPRTVALSLVAAGFAVFTLVVSRAVSGPALARVAVALLTCAMVANTVEAFKVMLSPDDRSPYRPLAERGFEPAVQRLNRVLSPADKLIGPKDVGYYFHGRAYRLDGIRHTTTGEADVVNTIRRSGVAYAVDSATNPVPDSDRLFREAGLQPIERVGDFVIYGLAK